MFGMRQANVTVRDWREAVEKIRELYEEYSRNYSIMTQYERTMANEAIGRAIQFYRPMVEAGAVGEFSAAARQFQAAQARIERERAKEIQSWEAARLADEMKVSEMRVSQALTRSDPVSELQALKKEAQASGDRYKMRATNEIIRGALGKLHTDNFDTRMLVNRLAQESERELSAMRESDAIKSAIDDGEGAFNALMACHRQLDSTARVLGDLQGNAGPYRGPIGKAWQRIHTGDNGEMIVDSE